MPIERARFTNTITLSEKPSSITSVTQKKSSSQFGSVVQDFTLSGKTITTTKVYDELIVDYISAVLTPQDVKIRKQLMNSSLGQFASRAALPALKTAAAKVQSQFAAANSTESKAIGELKAGFQTIAEDFREDVKLTDEPIPAVMTADVPGLTLTKTCTAKSELEILTGKTVNDGFLNATVTKADPKAINEAVNNLKEVLAPTTTQLRTILEDVSPVPDLVEESVKTDTIATFSTQSKNSKKTIDNVLQNPASNPGFSFTNMFASVVSAIKGKTPVIKPKQVITDITTNNVGFVEEFKLVDANSNTFTNRSLTTNDLVSENLENSVQAFSISSNNRSWDGAATSGEQYVFENIDTPEELELEILNTKRSITGVVVHWTRTYSDQFLKAEDLHKREIVKQRKALGDRFIQRAPTTGIQYHIVIQKDGTVQRGKPFDTQNYPGTAWAARGLHIAFVAGYSVPTGTKNADLFLSEQSITSEQWNSFDSILDVIYKTIPGVQFASHRDINPNSTCPGFDVQTYVESKFGKSTIYDDLTSAIEAFSDEEQVNIKSKKIAKEVEPLVGALKNLVDDLSDKFINTDPNTGETKKPTLAELEKSSLDYEALKKQAEDITREIDNTVRNTIESENFTDAFRDAAKTIKETLEQDLTTVEDNLLKARKDLMNSDYQYKTDIGWTEIT